MRRRDFVKTAAFAGAAGLGAIRPDRVSAEPPPETTTISLRDVPAACLSPQYFAEELLKAEGFTDVRFVKPKDLGYEATNTALASGEINFMTNDVLYYVTHLDAAPSTLVVLAGLHAGCYELFGTGSVRSILDLKGKRVSVAARGTRRALISLMAASVGLNPERDIAWVTQPIREGMRDLVDGNVDAFMGFAPEPQELRARKVGRVLVNTLTDRPWSQYFCCMLAASPEFVRKYPVATKRAMRAILRAADVCAQEPERVARIVTDRGFISNYDATLQALKDIGYRQWRTYNPEESIRFYALRLHEMGFIKTNPKKIIAEGTDWRFLKELKRELKA